MIRLLLPCLLFSCWLPVGHAAPGASIEVPEPVHTDGLVTLFAGEPDIQQPIGLVMDEHQHLLAIESHTHFPPEDYEGPDADRILWMRDENGDGRSEESTVWLDDLQNATDLALHPSGWVYITTCTEVLRARDVDGDGLPELVERDLARFESEGNHPHNRLSGIDFDPDGNVYFGMGENLGEPYTITLRDGSSATDQGEGGNIWWMTAEGGKLKRFATGFWNPFGVCTDSRGNVFATDNDPSSRPPSRLHWVVENGDYGYQYRYGRSGLHPFQAMDGELPGTLPMFAGVGDAPCDVVIREYRDRAELFVASWVDHRVEVIRFYYGSEEAERGVLVQGGADFRPVGLAFGPEGELYISDWVKRSYPVHGHGRIWKVSNPKLKDLDPTTVPAVAPILTLEDPLPHNANRWTMHAWIEHYARRGEKLRRVEKNSADSEDAEAAILTTWRRRGEAEGRDRLPDWLDSQWPQVRLLALKWIADERLPLKSEVQQMLEKEHDPSVFYAAVTTLARLEGADLRNDKASTELLLEHIRKTDADPVTRLAALKILPEPDRNLKLPDFELLLEADSKDLREQALWMLTLHPVSGKEEILRAWLENSDLPEEERAIALVGLPGEPLPETLPFTTSEARGRFIFNHPNLGGCAVCHQVEGVGREGGPDLSLIGQASETYIEQSLTDPSAEVAPQYQPWSIQTTDGRFIQGFNIRERGGTHWYQDITGTVHELKIEEIVSREQVPISVMPPGLLERLSPSHQTDLLNYLKSLGANEDS